MQFNLKFRDSAEDRQIVEHLKAQPNITQYMRDLIRADIANRQYSDRLIRAIREELLHTGELEMQNAELKKEIHRWQSGLKR